MCWECDLLARWMLGGWGSPQSPSSSQHRGGERVGQRPPLSPPQRGGDRSRNLLLGEQRLGIRDWGLGIARAGVR